MPQKIIAETSCPRNASSRKKILLLGDQPVFSEDALDYAINLAGRLQHELLVLSIDTQWQGGRFLSDAVKAEKALSRKAKAAGIDYVLFVKQGDPALAVEGLNRDEKRIEFVIADQTIDREALGQMALPIFSVLSKPLKKNGGVIMTVERRSHKRKLIAATIGYGCLSAALYTALFVNVEAVMAYFTRGGIFTLLPTATALAFSFSHSAFASSTYSLLGIEAARNKVLRQTEQKVIDKKKQVRTKPRARAYINPFHRI